ncbi:tetratricopeptide repeat protein [candidate division KSB1 bacterium]|nr:tetratricopeptide repeat protein [candidate division KSB1 bacterium]
MRVDLKKYFQYQIWLIFSLFVLFIQFSVFSQKASDFYKRAQKSNSLDERIEYLKQATMLDRRYTEAYLELGMALKEKKDYDQALLYLNRTLVANPTAVDIKLRFKVVYETGLVQQAAGYLKQARESLTAARGFTSDQQIQLDILYRLGEINMGLGKINDALANFLEGNRLAPGEQRFLNKINEIRQEKKLYDWYTEGTRLFSQQKYAEAIIEFDKILSEKSDFKDVSQKRNEAQTQLEKRGAPDKNSELDRLYLQGLNYFQDGKYDEAKNIFETILSKNPNYERAQNKLAEITKLSSIDIDDNPEKPLKTISTTVETTPQTEQTLEGMYQAGIRELTAQNWEGATIEFKRLLEIEPNFKDAAEKYDEAKYRLENQGLDAAKQQLYRQAKYAISNKDWINAVNYLERILNIDPNYRDTKNLLSETQKFLADTSETNLVTVLYNQGIQHMQKKSWLEALIAFEKIAVVDSDYENVQAFITEAKARLKKSQGELTRPVTAETDYSFIFITFGIFLILGLTALILFYLKPEYLAKIYLKRQNFNKAAQIYEKIWAKDHSNPEITLELAQIYHNQKRLDEIAIPVYESLIRLDLETGIKGEISTLVAYYYLSKGETESDKITRLEKVLNKEISKIKSKKG